VRSIVSMLGRKAWELRHKCDTLTLELRERALKRTERLYVSSAII
jgi:hypothetical protein